MVLVYLAFLSKRSTKHYNWFILTIGISDATIVYKGAIHLYSLIVTDSGVKESGDFLTLPMVVVVYL